VFCSASLGKSGRSRYHLHIAPLLIRASLQTASAAYPLKTLFVPLLQVTVTPDKVLQISGERKYEKEEGKEGEGVWRVERSYGSFVRRFRLPDNVDPEGACLLTSCLPALLPSLACRALACVQHSCRCLKSSAICFLEGLASYWQHMLGLFCLPACVAQALVCPGSSLQTLGRPAAHAARARPWAEVEPCCGQFF
jgi:hypothetical protein